MAKKQNPYSVFVYHIARQRQKRGENVIVANLFNELSDQWKSLSEEERRTYKDKSSSNNTDKFSNDRVPSPRTNESKANSTPIEPVEVKVENKPIVLKRSHEDDIFQVQEYKKLRPGIPNLKNHKEGPVEALGQYADIELLKIRNNCEAIVGSRTRKLIHIPFYSFSVNILCKKKTETEDIFVPIEIGICGTFLKDGIVKSPYHVLIDPGPIPTGCFNKASDHAKATHKITIPPQGYPEGARNDYKRIYKEMLDYTKEGERTILVEDVRDLEQVKASLEWLQRKASEDGSIVPRVSTWTILPLIEFTAAMYNLIWHKMLGNPTNQFLIHYHIKMSLEGSLMDYNKELMCSYHKQPDIETKWCAKSCANRSIMKITHIFDAIFQLFNLATQPAPPNPQPALIQAPVIERALAIIEPATGELPKQIVQNPKSDLLEPAEVMMEEDIVLALPAPKKPKQSEPLIIASEGRGFIEDPPDIF